MIPKGFGAQICTTNRLRAQFGGPPGQLHILTKHRTPKPIPLPSNRALPCAAKLPRYSNATRHFTPAGISPFGFGRSSRTPKVPLAESTTLSTMLTLAW